MEQPFSQDRSFNTLTVKNLYNRLPEWLPLSLITLTEKIGTPKRVIAIDVEHDG